MVGSSRFFVPPLTVLWAAVTICLCQNFRLPLNVIPYHYEINTLVQLDPALDFGFEGNVKIYFTCVEATDTVVVHNYYLVVKEESVVLQDSTGQEVRITGHAYDWDYADFQTISLAESLVPGKNYTLFIQYSGSMNVVDDGLFYGSYSGDQGIEYHAATQMEPLMARSVFPCFDEPGLKATFDIRIGHPEKYSASSNMPLVDTQPIEEFPGYVLSSYERSPVMPTYLVVMVVGDYQRVPTTDPRQFILVRGEIINDAGTAASYAPEILPELERRLNTPYTLPKLDHGAVRDYGGGMENWGLIVYAEDALAGEGNYAKLTLMTHETAHMWTGNLVTCQWWDVTWLNEGMTSFFEYYAADWVDPAEDYYLDYLGTRRMDDAKNDDGKSDARPMVVPINQPSDVKYAFSATLVYARGGNIGRFLYYLLGERAFLEGLKNYFAAYQYQPVREENMFEHLDDALVAAGEQELPGTLGELMTPWTNQAGFPVVTFTRGSSVGGSTTFNVTQKRFLYVTGNDHDDDRLWTVPLTWSTRQEPNFDDMKVKHYLSEAATEIQVSSLSDGEWIVVNNRRMGYYVVNYDDESWLIIASALKEDPAVFPDTNRAAILSDSADLCYFGVIAADVCFQLPSFLASEDSFIVWSSASRNFHKLLGAMNETDMANAMTQKMLKMVRKAEEKVLKQSLKDDVGTVGEPHMTARLLGEFREHLTDEFKAHLPFISTVDKKFTEWMDRKSASLDRKFARFH